MRTLAWLFRTSTHLFTHVLDADLGAPDPRFSLSEAAAEPDEDEVAAELERIRLESSPERIQLEQMEIPARKTDIAVDDVVLAWVPQEPLESGRRRAEGGVW